MASTVVAAKSIASAYKFDRAARDKALSACRTTGSRTKAAQAAGVSRRLLDEYLSDRGDPDFRAEWDAARRCFCEHLEEVAYRRAVRGWLEVKTEEGSDSKGSFNKTTKTTRKSDGLLRMLMEANDPDKYRPPLRVEQRSVTAHVVVSLDTLGERDLGDLERITANLESAIAASALPESSENGSNGNGHHATNGEATDAADDDQGHAGQ